MLKTPQKTTSCLESSCLKTATDDNDHDPANLSYWNIMLATSNMRPVGNSPSPPIPYWVWKTYFRFDSAILTNDRLLVIQVFDPSPEVLFNWQFTLATLKMSMKNYFILLLPPFKMATHHRFDFSQDPGNAFCWKIMLATSKATSGSNQPPWKMVVIKAIEAPQASGATFHWEFTTAVSQTFAVCPIA